MNSHLQLRRNHSCIHQHRFALRAEMKRTLSHALPLIGAQLLQMSYAMVDTLVAGRLGREQLAGVGLGSSLWMIVLLASIGLLAGLSPTMARAIGRSEQRQVGVLFRQGLWMAVALALFDLAVLGWIVTSLPNWGFETQLTVQTQHFLYAAMWGIVPAVMMLPARNVCEATGRTKPVLLMQCVGLVVNVFADLGFGLGWFGLPALGLAGIGWSTTLVTLSNCLVLFWLVRSKGFARYALFSKFDGVQVSVLRQLLILSAPICLAILFEAGLFTATALQMGLFGTLAMSAHNVAIGVTALFYMLPMGLSFTLTARIGQAYGRAAYPALRLRVLNGVVIALMMAFSSAALLLLLRHSIASLYTADLQVQLLTAKLFLLAALFQISDDLQVTLFGMLRGLHDTRVPMLINAFSYWVIAAGLGYLSAHHFGLGPYGLWMGLIIGLTLSAALLGWRLLVQLRKLPA